MLVHMRHFDGPMIRVEFPALAKAADDIHVAMQAMDTSLNDLDTSLRSKLASWDGGAFGDYSATKAVWDTAANNIKTLLGSISRAVNTSNEQMAATEMRNALRFQR